MIEIDTTKRKGKFFSILFMFMLLLCTPFWIVYEKVSIYIEGKRKGI